MHELSGRGEWGLDYAAFGECEGDGTKGTENFQSLLVSVDDWEGRQLVDGILAVGMTERRA